ncbi:MAG: radical SAM protein [Gammaproteobacteria bacterium]|nr:radical SAM protein [Gammaproteobacteria bacterium]
MSDKQSLRFAFSPHIRLVEGQVGLCVHDLFRTSVYWLKDANVAKLIVGLSKGKTVREMATQIDLPEANMEMYLTLLEEIGIGKACGNKTMMEGFRPVLTRKYAQQQAINRTGGTVTLEITGECIYNCEWCVSHNRYIDTACGCGVWPDQGAAVETGSLISTLERLHEKGYDKLVIRGGEPFLEKSKLFEIINRASELSMMTTVHTTGVLIDQPFLEQVANLNIQFVLLVPCADSSSYENFTNIKNGWHRLLQAFALLNKTKLQFSAKIPANVCHLDSSFALIDWVKAQGATKVSYIAYTTNETNALNGDEQKLRLLYALAKTSPTQMAVDVQSFYQNAQCQSCFDNNCTVAKNGDVIPCMGIRKPVANLHKTSITEVLREDLMLDYQTTTGRSTTEPCARCEFRFGCWSCLAQNDFLAESDDNRHWNCLYDPKTTNWDEVAEP